MSPRTFARRFVQETGTTPLRWLTGQRILLAQRLLEETDESVDAGGLAGRVRQRDRVPAPLPRLARLPRPNAYRRTFRAARAGRGRPGGGIAAGTA